MLAALLVSGYGDTAVAQTVHAEDDEYAVDVGETLSVPPPGVLDNDRVTGRLDDSDLSAELLEDVDNGTLSLDSDGSFTYVPDPGFSGEDRFEYRASFALLFSDEAEVTLRVLDPLDEAPTITLNGDATMEVAQGETFEDPGATAADAEDGDLTDQIEVTGSVDTNEPGSYTLTYTVTDSDGNEASASRTVIVVEDDDGGEDGDDDDDGDGDGDGDDDGGGDDGDDGDGDDDGGDGGGRGGDDAGDVAVTLAVAPNPVVVDELATWTLEVTNNGEQPVNSVVIDGTFAGAVPFRFDSPSDASCTLSQSGNDTSLDCAIGPVSPDGPYTIELTGSASRAGDLSANVEASIEGGRDSSPDDNTAAATLSVTGNAGSSPAQEISGIDARALGAGDFDGDDRIDLAVATGPERTVLVFPSVPDPNDENKLVLSEEPTSLGSAATADNGIAVADLDGDGDLDVVAAGGAGVANRVYLNDGAGRFEGSEIGGTDAEARAVDAGDVDGDGFTDLVFANAGADTVYLGAGTAGAYSEPLSVGSAASRDVLVADLFGNPALELVFAHEDADATIYRREEDAFAVALTLSTGPATSIAAADFDGDGATDLAFGRGTPDDADGASSNLVFLNTSGASPSFFRLDPLGSTPTVSVVAADTDLDDSVDIVSLNSIGAHRIYVNAGDGSAAFSLHPRQPVSEAPRDGLAARLSVDDRVDLAVAGADGIGIFYNDGSGNLGPGDTQAPTIELIGEPSVSLQVGEAWSDPGATASDDADGDLTDAIQSDADELDTDVVGTHVVSYNVTDSSGNAATTVTRNVEIQARQEGGGGGGAAALLGVVLLLALCVRRPAPASGQRRPHGGIRSREPRA